MARRVRLALLSPLILLMNAPLCPQTAEPAAGISQELAEAREKVIRDVRYELSFKLEKGMKVVQGRCKAHFTLPARVSKPIVIDFAGESIKGIVINGEGRTHVRQVHNHLVIPKSALQSGKNVFEAEFTSKVAATGTPLTVYKDKTDGKEYYYTLVVPADAHRLFPCFDQPGLKAVYALQLQAPKDWVVVANGAGKPASRKPIGDARSFEDTRPLSTYLFAFAAGPFVETKCNEPIVLGDRKVPMRIFLRESKLKEVESDKLFAMHQRSVKWLSAYFDHDYPFRKLDIVLTPGFPYGGMEHAGAIFYRETALAFDHKPTQGELTRRSTLIYHEVSHQWFGNLVTMKWFDDLWLKEGFATFMGYTLLESLEPGKRAWLRFHQRVKPRAYSVDATSGTTPVYQKLENLADAKSQYGAIVYNKAPAVLRELNVRLGPQVFQKGLQIFLKRHAFGNATWQDLVKALEEAAKASAAHWSNRWILAAGMPRVRVEWSADRADRIAAFRIRQQSLQNDKGTWPLRLEVLLLDGDDSHRTIKLTLDEATKKVPGLIGKPVPVCVLLNPGDVAYGQFLLDPRSREHLVEHVHEIKSPLLRAVAMSALFQTLREAELRPERYVHAALRLLRAEQDPETHGWLLSTVGTTLSRYMSEDRSFSLSEEVVPTLLEQLHGRQQGIKLQTLRFLVRISIEGPVTELCQQIIDGENPIAGLKIGRRDRFLVAASLVANGARPDAIVTLREQAGKEDIAKEVFLAGAATPDPAVKKRYFKAYLNLDEPPEQWTSDSLGYFHWPRQDEITLPYLSKALGQLEWVKENRKVFFMPAWIDAFVNGHSSKEALRIVHKFMGNNPDLSLDIRRKLLQSLDSLERAVKIKERWK
jgi:aminopeptidase N